MGGRPSCPIRLEPGVWDPSGCSEELHVVLFWANQKHQFVEKEERWKDFRDHQQQVRETPEKFVEWQKTALLHRRNYGLEGDVTLCLEAERQTKLDEWKEFQTYWRHSIAPKLQKFEQKLIRAEKVFELKVKEWEEANLDAIKSCSGREEIRKAALKPHRAALSWPKGDFERETALLKWIADQLPLIAEESLASDQNGKKDVSAPGFVLRRSKRIAALHANNAPPPSLAKHVETTANDGKPAPPPAASTPARRKRKGISDKLASTPPATSASKKLLTAAVRRSPRLAGRGKNVAAQASNPATEAAHVTTNAQAKSVRQTKVKSKAAASPKPRGVSKKRNR